jgi:hypothetical protein
MIAVNFKILVIVFWCFRGENVLPQITQFRFINLPTVARSYESLSESILSCCKAGC